MALIENYLVKADSLHSFLNSLLNARAPEKFTLKFLEQLEFKSTNDRLLIGLLKGLNFLDDNSVPTKRYFEFLDQSQSKTILAEAIKDAYSDLFAVNTKINELGVVDIKNKLKTITQGTKSDNVLRLMANTFKSLCDYADFKDLSSNNEIVSIRKEEKQENFSDNIDANKYTHELINKKITTEMHYNIQIHLPETRDITVYDAIFKSLKQHLL
jgi:hypothetical protein